MSSTTYDDFFRDTKQIFRETKQYVLLIEKYAAIQSIPIGSINELRGTLFHLYNLDDSTKNTEEEYIEAKEHLYRACYDTYSILVSILLENIYEIRNKYSDEVISQVFPKYFHDILPKLISLKAEVSYIQANRETAVFNGKNDNEHNHREANILLLIQWSKEVESFIPELVIKRKSVQSKKWMYWGITIVIAILSAIFGSVLS